MKQQAAYERIARALAEARQSAMELSDSELESDLRDLEAMVIDRLYSVVDRVARREAATSRAK